MIVKAPASPRASEPGFSGEKRRGKAGKIFQGGFAQFFWGAINCRGRLAPATKSFGVPLRQVRGVLQARSQAIRRSQRDRRTISNGQKLKSSPKCSTICSL
jgi:hypothetical protein